MPRFHLHLRHGSDRVEDLEGSEYDNLMSARAGAIVAAHKVLADRLNWGYPSNGSRFEIADEGGEILLVLPLHDGVSP